MRFSPQFLDDLRARVPLGEVVGRRVKLARAGRELKGLCPFHSEKTPSFHVVEEKGFYHCFGCGAHGDIFTFLTESEGLSFREAVEEMAGKAGMELPKPDPKAREREEHRASLHEVMEAATRFYQEQLGRGLGRTARHYLDTRGITQQTVLDFRLGFAPESHTALREALTARGISEEQLLEAGLLVKPDDGRTPYDRFRNRILFPITDRRGHVIAFGGRALDDNPAKYLNSPDTPLFHKGLTLYNLSGARKAAYDAGSVIVVEGYTDVLALAQAEMAHAVAPLGTALTEDQIAELWRLAPEPVLCFDGDSAGLRAADRAIERALPLLRPGQSLRFAMLPAGLDPDDLIRSEGPAAMRAVLEAAMPLADMLWQTMTANADTATPERRAALEAAIFERLERIGDDKVRHFYRREFKDRLFKAFSPIRSGRAQGRWQKGARSQNRSGGQGAAAESGSRLLSTRLARRNQPDDTQCYEQLVMLHAINHPWLAETYSEDIAALTFADPALDKLRQELLSALGARQDLDYRSLRTHLAESGYDETVTQLESSPVLKPARSAWPEASVEEAETGWQHVLARLRRLTLKREIAAAEAEMAADQSEEAWQRLTTLIRELERSGGTEAEVEGYIFRSA